MIRGEASGFKLEITHRRERRRSRDGRAAWIRIRSVGRCGLCGDGPAESKKGKARTDGGKAHSLFSYSIFRAQNQCFVFSLEARVVAFWTRGDLTRAIAIQISHFHGFNCSLCFARDHNGLRRARKHWLPRLRSILFRLPRLGRQ